MTDQAARLARIRAAKDKATVEAEAWVRSRLWALEDDTANGLGELYVNAYRRLVAELDQLWARYVTGDNWKASDASFRERTEVILKQIENEVQQLTDAATRQTLISSIRGYQAGYYGRGWVLDQGLRSGSFAAVPLLPAEAIRAALLAPYKGSTFLDRFQDARVDFVRQVRRGIIESQIAGEGIGSATRRLRNLLGMTAQEGYGARLEMIARTEILRASNLGALEIYEKNRDVLTSVQWLATNDERTCPLCGPLDGQIFKFGDPQIPPPAHPNCRCTTVPVLADQEIERAIVRPRQTYTEWAAERGISVIVDGGGLAFKRGAPPPKK